jgi:hypothetical protein
MKASMRKHPIAPAVAAVVVVLGMVSSAHADPADNQRFVITATDLSGTSTLLATGPFHGVGTDHLVSHTDNPDGTSTDTDQFDLPAGMVFLRDTYRAEITTDPDSCVTRITVQGTYSLTGGTGAYSGATGAGTFSAAGTLVAHREEAGCLGFDAPPRAFVEIVRGTGTTTLP